jgi:hypothetical protein
MPLRAHRREINRSRFRNAQFARENGRAHVGYGSILPTFATQVSYKRLYRCAICTRNSHCIENQISILMLRSFEHYDFFFSHFTEREKS